jgi:GTP-binding protein
VRAAIDEADVIICVLDGTVPSTAADRESVQLLRRSERPVLYVANKVDNAARELEAHDLYRLGIEHLLPLSALHGKGSHLLEEALAGALPAPEPVPPQVEKVPRLALIGRPNAGKSSLFNRLGGSERSLVDGRPGTTRDPVDMLVEFHGQRYLVVDTAGIRRRSKVDDGVESASVLRSIRSIGRAQVVALLCDATEGVKEQDARLMGLCMERQRALVVGLNKVDLLSPSELKAVNEKARDALHFAPWAPVLPLSARTGQGVERFMQAVERAASEFGRRVPTGELNRFFESIIARQPPPTRSGRAPRLYYITQARTNPPLFVAMCSSPAHLADSYRRFVVNQIRKAFDFKYVPLRVQYRKRSRKDKG